MQGTVTLYQLLLISFFLGALVNSGVLWLLVVRPLFKLCEEYRIMYQHAKNIAKYDLYYGPHRKKEKNQ